MALQLRNRLSKLTGLALPATLVFDYPTPTRLADDTIAVVYRGQVSVPPSSAFPMRLAMLDAAGTVYRSGVDLTAGDFRTYLYGGIVAHAVVGNPDWLIASLEGPDGSTGSYAEVQATPLSQVSY